MPTSSPPIPLTDEEMRQFIVDGYLVLDSGLPSELHEQIDSQLAYTLKREGNHGNNILPAIPEMHRVLESPRIRGALQSVLGEDYLLHPHRFAHNIEPAEIVEGEQKIGKGSHSFVGWHQDSHSPLSRPRHHYFRYAMILYYPQDTPIERGPTQLIPGTYLNQSIPDTDKARGIQMAGQAGTCVLVHFDIVHGGSMNISDRSRYMVKFVFARASEPEFSPFYPQQKSWQNPTKPLVTTELPEFWSHLWQWLQGENPESGAVVNPESLEKWLVCLSSGEEPRRQRAIYCLASLGRVAVEPLVRTLLESHKRGWTEDAVVMEEASYALAAIGSPAIPALVSLLESENEWIQINATFALGEMGSRAKEAVPALLPLLNHPSHAAVRMVLDALGQIRVGTAVALPEIHRLLTQDNPNWATMIYRAWTGQNQVRMNAMMALIRMGDESAGAEEWISEVLDDACGYVGGWGIEWCLRRGTPKASEIALEYLYRHRWDNTLRQGIRTY